MRKGLSLGKSSAVIALLIPVYLWLNTHRVKDVHLPVHRVQGCTWSTLNTITVCIVQAKLNYPGRGGKLATCTPQHLHVTRL